MLRRNKVAAIDELTAMGEEEARRQRELAAQQQQQINDYVGEFNTRAADYRTSLSNRLSSLAQQDFQAQNPYIIEDAAARGYATSPSELSNIQSRYLADLSRGNQRSIMDLENQNNMTSEGLRQEALATGLQGGQNALDSLIEMRRAGIQRDYAVSDQARQEALANALAKRSSRDSMTGAMIGAGGNILGGLLKGGGGGGGFLSSLFGGGGTAAGGGATSGMGVAGAPGMGSMIAPALGAGAVLGLSAYGGQKLGNAVFKSKKAEKRARAGATIGTALGGPLGSVTGSMLGGLTASRPARAVSRAFKKAFCFHEGTPIEMLDGSTMPIHLIRLGDETKGGKVESIRVSFTADGTRFNYKGVVVTGSHAVNEGGVWKRVETSTESKPIGGAGIVYSLVTDGHRIFSNGIEFADEHETDDYETLSINESLDVLNGKELSLVR